MAYKVEISSKSEEEIVQGVTDSGVREHGISKTLYCVHPKFSNIKLIALAEGSVYTRNGGDAAKFLIKAFMKKFSELEEEDFTVDGIKDPALVSQATLSNVIKKVMEANLLMLGNNRGNHDTLLASASIAITDGSYVCVSNVGDTVCFYTQDGELEKCSEFHPAWTYNFAAELGDPEFNIPDTYYGDKVLSYNPTFIEYSSLGTLVLSTRSVDKSLSDDSKKQIIDYASPENIASTLVNFSKKEPFDPDEMEYDPYGLRGMAALSFSKTPSQKLKR